MHPQVWRVRWMMICVAAAYYRANRQNTFRDSICAAPRYGLMRLILAPLADEVEYGTIRVLIAEGKVPAHAASASEAAGAAYAAIMDGPEAQTAAGVALSNDVAAADAAAVIDDVFLLKFVRTQYFRRVAGL